MFTLTPDIAARIEALTPLERVETDAKHRFRRVQGGEWLPSLTTILQAMPKPQLVVWSAKVEREMVCKVAGDLFAKVNGQRLRAESFAATLAGRLPTDYAHDTVKEIACNTGTEAHAMIDWTVRRELGDTFTPEPGIGVAARLAFTHWQEWWRAHSFQSLAVERDGHHPEVGYSFRLDWVGMDSDGLVLNDWKTGRGIYPDAHLQVAAEIMALRRVGIPIRTGYIVRLPKVEGDPVWREAEVGHMAAGRKYTIEELFDVFCNVKQLWDWLHHTKKPALTGRTAKKAAPSAPATEHESPAAGNGAAVAARITGGTDAPPVAASGMSEVEAARWRRDAHERLARAGFREADAASRKVRTVLELGDIYELKGPLSGEQWKEFCERFEAEQQRGQEQVLEAAGIGKRKAR